MAGGFTADDFTIDEDAGTVTCPAGVTRTLTRAWYAVFGAACRACPLRVRCTTAKDGRTVRLHPHDALLRQARRDWADRDDLRETYRRHRPNGGTLHRLVDRPERSLVAGCATAAWPPTTSGCTPAWPPSTLRRLINLGLT